MDEVLYCGSFQKQGLIHPYQQLYEKTLKLPFYRYGHWGSNMSNYLSQVVRPEMWMITHTNNLWNPWIQTVGLCYPTLWLQKTPSPLLCEMTPACSSDIHFPLWVQVCSAVILQSACEIILSNHGISSPTPSHTHVVQFHWGQHQAARLAGLQGLTVTTICLLELSMWSQK